MHTVIASIRTAFCRVHQRFYSTNTALCNPWRSHIGRHTAALDVCQSALHICYRTFATLDDPALGVNKHGLETPDAISLASGHPEPRDVAGWTQVAEDFVVSMADIADRVVFERHKCSRQAKESIRSLGSKGVSDIFSMLAGSNSQAVNNLDNIWTVSVISYSCAASGISIPTEVLLGYINAVYKQMSQLLQGGGSTITTLDNTEETVLHRLSEAFGLLLLSAAEFGLFNNLKQITNELLHQPLMDKFLHHSSGSCINAVAFVDANDSMYSSMNDTALVNAILESLSNKEMSLTTRDLFYAKLWVTRVGTMAPQNVIHSFVQNVVMLDHVSELVGAATDAETSVFTKLREQHRDVDMDFLTLEPFVFPLVSSMSKELYEPDHAECYFDQDGRTWKREYLNWRKMTADANGWKVVNIIL